jgi:hypothetical protein
MKFLADEELPSAAGAATGRESPTEDKFPALTKWLQEVLGEKPKLAPARQGPFVTECNKAPAAWLIKSLNGKSFPEIVSWIEAYSAALDAVRVAEVADVKRELAALRLRLSEMLQKAKNLE